MLRERVVLARAHFSGCVQAGGRAGALVRSIEAFPAQMRQTSLIKCNERVPGSRTKMYKKLQPTPRAAFFSLTLDQNELGAITQTGSACELGPPGASSSSFMNARLRVIFHYLLFDSAVIYRPLVGDARCTMYR